MKNKIELTNSFITNNIEEAVNQVESVCNQVLSMLYELKFNSNNNDQLNIIIDQKIAEWKQARKEVQNYQPSQN